MTAYIPRKYIVNLMQLLISAFLVYLGSFNNFDALDSLDGVRIARFAIHLLTIQVSEEILTAFYTRTSENLVEVFHDFKLRLAIIIGSTSVALISGFWLFERDFLCITLASFLVKYKDKTMSAEEAAAAVGPRKISYGTGMACSFFEGYLRHILPPDENDYSGFKGAIKTYESNERVRFPVHQLFLVITKSLHCPPSLAYFNKDNRPDLPCLEACKSLEDVQKNVAGVQRRIYRNSAYQVRRPGRRPVYLAVECATPLHTLHRVLTNRALYDELSHVNPDEIREDFCSMLERILLKSPDCQGRCTLVYYDDQDPEQNLAEILLNKIEELAPNFEEIIADVQRD